MSSIRRSKVSTATSQSNFIGAVPDEWQLFSDNPQDYSIGPPIGFGASSTVYTAVYQQTKSRRIPCALKVLDLDLLPPHSLRLLQRETQLMSLSKHPNVLRVRGSWIDGHKLYIALRLMNSGSAADVMRYGWPGGMEEEVVKCILKQALEGLSYLHKNGFIHRDIKAANLLIDDDGTVLLGDLGVAASLSDEEAIHHQHPASKTRVNFNSTVESPHIKSHPTNKIGKRKSFVGTPCWMAPELISGKQYDSKADIWSFGITALELTQGRAPRSREPPAQVLMRTVQDEPPAFKRDGGPHRYSKAFQDVVESCVIKDPSRRPTAAQLLEMPFFKSGKKKSYLVGAVLSKVYFEERGTILKEDLPPLSRRLELRSRQCDCTMQTLESWDFTLSNSTSPERSSTRGSCSKAESRNSLFDFEEDTNELATRSDSQSSEEDEESSSYPTTPEPTKFIISSSSSPSYFPTISPKDRYITATSRYPKFDDFPTSGVSVSDGDGNHDARGFVSPITSVAKSSVWGKRRKQNREAEERDKGPRAFVGRMLDRAADGVEGGTTTIQRIASRKSINALKERILQ